MPATLVPQLTSYTCSLACLESYFSETAHPLSQCEMLLKHQKILENPDPKKQCEYGTLNDTDIPAFCHHLGFVSKIYQDKNQGSVDKTFATALAAKIGVLISSKWKNNTGHCVRLSDVKSAGIYEVMCPKFHNASLEIVAFADLVSWDFRIITVER